MKVGLTTLHINYLKSKFNWLTYILFGNFIPWRNVHFQHWGRESTTWAWNIFVLLEQKKILKE